MLETYMRCVDGFGHEGGVSPDLSRPTHETLGYVAEVEARLDTQPLLGHQ